MAEALTGDARRRLDGRDRLRQPAAEVDRLNQSNASLLHHCLSFLQQFFADLTGGAGERRYGRNGAYQEAACGSLLQMRG